MPPPTPSPLKNPKNIKIRVFEAWDSNNQFRLEISSNLPRKLHQTVEYCLKNERQTFEKH